MKLVIERGRTVPFSALPPRSIALDGYVQGPAIDAEQERYSFDHHGGCVRHATRSTAEQVHDAIVLGLDPNGLTIYCNDVDLDTALAVWLLANPHRAQEELVGQLTVAAGLLDAHSGAYPVGPAMRHVIEWLSEPETRARANGQYWAMDDVALGQLLGNVSRRIDVYTHGEARADVTQFAIDERYEIEREGTGWVLARTVGTRAHGALFRDGYLRLLIYRQLPDGSYGYTVAKRSEFVKFFPVGEILQVLDQHEPGWGGGSTIGGAPRNADGSRSRISPDEIFSIIEAVVVKTRIEHNAPTTAASPDVTMKLRALR
ncbi:MAG: hypothetical protein Q8Q09_03485 [Deltaproteobacteria bacterium]|nr:hypothetical protein [Deltaproteobacteria bacterium]